MDAQDGADEKHADSAAGTALDASEAVFDDEDLEVVELSVGAAIAYAKLDRYMKAVVLLLTSGPRDSREIRALLPTFDPHSLVLAVGRLQSDGLVMQDPAERWHLTDPSGWAPGRLVNDDRSVIERLVAAESEALPSPRRGAPLIDESEMERRPARRRTVHDSQGELARRIASRNAKKPSLRGGQPRSEQQPRDPHRMTAIEAVSVGTPSPMRRGAPLPLSPRVEATAAISPSHSPSYGRILSKEESPSKEKISPPRSPPRCSRRSIGPGSSSAKTSGRR